MDCMTDTTIRCRLDNGTELTLDANDCAEILNAMARSRLLAVNIEDVPDGYDHIQSEEICAFVPDADDGDARVMLCVNASDFIAAHPRSGKTKRKK
jgi:hypothetical protein